MVLTVSGPGGLILRREFGAGIAPSLELLGDDGKTLPDGAYTYELIATPVLDQATRQALATARWSGDASIAEKLRGKLSREPLVQSGSFTVSGGAIVPQDLEEEPTGGTPRSTKPRSRLTSITAEDQVTPDDLILQGSICTGLDCVNNESFGFDVIRLKEDNLRIKFQDVSTASGFPSNDWQLTANDTVSGGADRFSIEDVTSARVPFTVTAGAASNSIFVDSTGRIGFRTATPALDLHVNTSSEPALRFEQNNSGGLTPQTWDIAGNETNFFVRDVTGGNRQPFRIRSGAPTSSIDIAASGNVGIGTASPDAKLEVEGSNGSTKLEVEETSGTTTNREIMDLRNNGGVTFVLTNTNTVQRWGVGMNGTDFLIDNQGNAGFEFTLGATGNLGITGNVGIGTSSPSNKLHVFGSSGTLKAFIQETSGTTTARELLEIQNNGGAIVILKDTSQTPRWSFGTSGASYIIDNQASAGVEFSLTSTGSLTIAGTLTQGSSREAKANFESLDPRTVLARVSELPISVWTYKQDNARHLGPMAEDFHQAFGLGADDKGIAPGDQAGVALAAVQGLNQVVQEAVQEKDKEIAELKSRIETLEKLVQSLAQEKGAAEN